jgi:hypothetical protein
MRYIILLAIVLLLSWTASAYADKPCTITVYKNIKDRGIAEQFDEKLFTRSSKVCNEAALAMLEKKCKSGSLLGKGLLVANGIVIKKEEKCRYDLSPESELIKAKWFFDNTEFTEEHVYGDSIRIWEYRGKLLGILVSQEGLVGNPSRALLHKVKYDKNTGRLSFEANLDGEKIKFSGTVGKEFLVSDEGSTIEKLKIEKWNHRLYPVVQRYSEWEKGAKDVISFSRVEWTY